MAIPTSFKPIHNNNRDHWINLNQKAPLLNLSNEVIINILARVPPQDQFRLHLTCKRIFAITQNSYFYERMIPIFYGSIPKSLYEENPQKFIIDSANFAKAFETGSIATQVTRLPHLLDTFEWVHLTKEGVAIGYSMKSNPSFPQFVIYDTKTKSFTKLQAPNNAAIIEFVNELEDGKIIIRISIPFKDDQFKIYDIRKQSFESIDSINEKEEDEQQNVVWSYSLDKLNVKFSNEFIETFNITKNSDNNSPILKIDIRSLNDSCEEVKGIYFSHPNKLYILSKHAIWSVIPLNSFDLLNLVNQQHKEIKKILQILSYFFKKETNTFEKFLLADNIQGSPISLNKIIINFSRIPKEPLSLVIHCYSPGIKFPNAYEYEPIEIEAVHDPEFKKQIAQDYPEWECTSIIRNFYPYLFKQMNDLPKEILQKVFETDFSSLSLSERITRIDNYLNKQTKETKASYPSVSEWGLEQTDIEDLLQRETIFKGDLGNLMPLINYTSQKFLGILENGNTIKIPDLK